MADQTPLLDLGTLAEHSTVVIDAGRYALLAPEALPLLDYKRVMDLGPKLTTLLAKPADELTNEDTVECDRLLEQLCRIVLQAPLEVHDRLTPVQRWMVYKVFHELPLTRPQGGADDNQQRRHEAY
jgi:hypothetical protein